jgi:hypothetical protein
MCFARKISSMVFVSILACLFMIQLSLADTHVFRPEDHSVYLDQRDPDTNFVHTTGILVASELNENARIVIHFDLGRWVAVVDSITQANLYLYHYRGGNYTGSRTINAYSLTSAFNESTATWNSPWITPGGDYDGSIGASAEVPEEWENWVSWDVTEILKNRWTNVVNCGFLLKDAIEDAPPPDGPYVRFHSHRKDSLPYLEVQTTHISGDVNGDGVVNSADVVYLINYLFKGGPPPDPWWVGDANCDGVVNSADVVYLINYLFKRGTPPGCQ